MGPRALKLGYTDVMTASPVLLKRFLVFCFNHYEPLGGWADHWRAFDTLPEALACMDNSSSKDRDAHVVDLVSGEIVSERIKGGPAEPPETKNTPPTG